MSTGAETMVNIDELRTLADSLAVVCDADTLATILDATLGADGDERLDDDQANVTTMFFEYLCQRRPDCVSLAQHQQGLLTDSELATAQKATA
jgi:hypothetical protein